MNFEDALKAGGASATILAIAGIALKLVQTFCGHRLRSECCGKEGTVGVAVEQMTPRSQRPSIEVRVDEDKPAPRVSIVSPSMTVGSPPPSHKPSPSVAAAPSTDVPPLPPLAI